MKAVKKITQHQAGVALLTTMLLMLLMSSLLVGFMLLVNSGQKLGGMNNDASHAFYASEAGMEKMTADLGTLFDSNYSPTGAQLAVIQANPPVLNGITYKNASGTNGYILDFPKDGSGNPVASVTQIRSGAYQGMTALATPYTLTVNARTTAGSEVKLTRSTQTVGIPMFQFGIFSETDLSFFPGPAFNFGGRTHTNGNLFLASGNTLTLADRVTAVKDIVRTNLSNNFSTTTGAYGGTVNITTSPGTSSYRAMDYTEGSLTGTLGSSPNPLWSNISLGATTYAGNVRSGSTGATKLDLGIVTLGGGSTQAIDILRRPVPAEDPKVTAERYYAQASMKILLSDNPQDITNLPCTTPSAPFNLATIAAPVAQWPAAPAAAGQLLARLNANNVLNLSTQPLPLAASGAVQGRATYTMADRNGYWLQNPVAGTQNPALAAGQNFSATSGLPTIKGYIKIEIQTAYGNPCGTWQDVTLEVLGYGYTGGNINPYANLNLATNRAYPASTVANSQVTPGFVLNGINPPLLLLPAGQLAPSGCPDPHPNAIIRLQRIRDNPSNWAPNTGGNPFLQCGLRLAGGATGVVVNGSLPPFPTDYWPNALFDTREGTLRDNVPANALAGAAVGGVTYNGINYNAMVTMGGVMNYIEIDGRNLARYLGGALGGSGALARDAAVAPNDFAVYVSDRRGNYAAIPPAGIWPPKSPTQTETGEYGFEDYINSGSPAGCPSGGVETAEDVDGIGSALQIYGQDPTRTMAVNVAIPALTFGQYGFYNNTMGASTISPIVPNPLCPGVNAPSVFWPMDYVVHANEARENPNPFFRRAVKLTNASDMSVIGACPGGLSCGLTIAAENPVYIEGDYNCPGNCAGNVFNDGNHIATSVLGDAVTLLSNSWNDVNSFTSPFTMANRNAVTTYYRTAIVAGKNISFPIPTGYAVPNDFGTDGGVHNFLRYIENWGGQTLNYKGSIISLFYSRQATGLFKCCTTTYSPPSRGYNFDVEFLQPALLPPRTPLFRDTNTTGFTQLLLPNQ